MIKGILKNRSASESKVERWLGKTAFEAIRKATVQFYSPILVGYMPGVVFAHKGDFYGNILGGQFASLEDKIDDSEKTAKNLFGFSSLPDLQTSARAGRIQIHNFIKTDIDISTSAYENCSNSLFKVGSVPAAGAQAAAAPGGTVPTSSSAGALPIIDAASGETLHYINGFVQNDGVISASNAPQTQATLLLYDRIFAVRKTMSSTATEAVTGVPTRYQSTTAGAHDSAEGNFVFPEIHTAISNTAHNWTVCTYTDQAGNASTMPSQVGISSSQAPVAGTIDMSRLQRLWFMPLEAGDTGIKALTQMQCSASVTGAVDFVMGHAIAFIPMPRCEFLLYPDGINSCFNLARVYDSACLALLNLFIFNPHTDAGQVLGSTFQGQITLVSS